MNPSLSNRFIELASWLVWTFCRITLECSSPQRHRPDTYSWKREHHCWKKNTIFVLNSQFVVKLSLHKAAALFPKNQTLLNHLALVGRKLIGKSLFGWFEMKYFLKKFCTEIRLGRELECFWFESYQFNFSNIFVREGFVVVISNCSGLKATDAISWMLCQWHPLPRPVQRSWGQADQTWEEMQNEGMHTF